MSASNRLIVAMLVVVALAVAFWMLALGPKRQEASDLAGEIGKLHASLAESQTQAAEAVAAKREFPADYHQLVVLGKAVPPSDETSSLLIELNQIASRSGVKFNSIQLGSGAGEGESAPAAATTTTPTPTAGASGATPAAATIPPTEVAASLLPLGAAIGPAGLAVMPYDLTFNGDFFQIADFIKGIDSLIHTGKNVGVDGRLVTLNGFALSGNSEIPFPDLDATFSVTTYLTPPSQGVTAGATPTAPSATTPAATTSSETPTAASTPVSSSSAR
jgi:Tfp pilus assembly protein PilO